jgi:hypothetical protein
MREKKAAGAILEDAELLAKFAGLRPDRGRSANKYEEFLQGAMGLGEL